MSRTHEGKEEGVRDPFADRASEKLLEFFERNKSFFSLYAGDSSIEAKPSRSIGTFAIDLEKGVLYGDPSYYEKKGLTEAHAFNSFLHEFEHFRRLMTLVREPNGLEKWKQHRDRMKAKPHLHVFDNVLEDISVDRAILTRAPNQRDTQEELYRTHLWKERDLRSLPKHLQFIYGLFREQMLPDEPVEVAEDVRAEIDGLRARTNASGQHVVEVMTNPELPQEKRLALQQRFFEPIYEKLFEEDVKKKEEENSKGEGGEKVESSSPDDLFKELYDQYLEQSPDAALAEKDLEEAVQKFLTEGGGKPKTAEELATEAYAKEVGVSVQDLKAYQAFWKQVEELRSPESDETIVEEIRSTFRQIVSERKKRVARPKQPVEDGEYLVRPAEAVAEIQAGRMNPRVWRTQEVKEHPREIVGVFDVTIVCDRSVSMEESDGTNVKNIEQQKAALLLLEALREFCDDLDEERDELKEDLHVRSEVYGFGDATETVCLKPLSEELSDKDRIHAFKELATTKGSATRDDVVLATILQAIPEEDLERIARKELRKIVIVLTDGNSSNAEEAKKNIQALREKGVVVVAIGITSAASEAVNLYAPDGVLAETASMVGVRVGEVLKDFIRGLNE